MPVNFGLGVATHIAFDHALRHGFQALVRVDADGQHPIEAVSQLLSPLQNGDADIVVARRVNRSEGRGLRNIAAKVVRTYLSLVGRLMSGGATPRDLNSGFFALNREAISVLNSTLLEHYPEPQMFVLAARRGLRVVEVEVAQRTRQHGVSTVTLGHALRLLYRFNIFVLAELLQKSRTP